MTFDGTVIEHATKHMNEDHADGNLYIVQAFIDPTAESATMTTLDNRSGTWDYVAAGETKAGSVPWSKEISERVEIRHEVVALYKQAVAKLGVEDKAGHFAGKVETVKH